MEIRGAAVAAIVAHAREDAPLECCGLLIGTDGRIERAHRARNVLGSPTRFRVAPEDHFTAIRGARREGLAVVGAYHSHPASEPRPSPTDVHEANDAAFVHVIVSLVTAEPGMHAYRIGDGNFVELPLVPVP